MNTPNHQNSFKNQNKILTRRPPVTQRQTYFLLSTMRIFNSNYNCSFKHLTIYNNNNITTIMKKGLRHLKIKKL